MKCYRGFAGLLCFDEFSKDKSFTFLFTRRVQALGWKVENSLEAKPFDTYEEFAAFIQEKLRADTGSG